MGSASIARARRPFFVSTPKGSRLFDDEEEVEFDWHKGMSWKVRQRSSCAMAEAICERYPYLPKDILEVSTKSTNYKLGSALSAFNLKMACETTGRMFPLENWFQSSKRFRRRDSLFDEGVVYGPYRDLLEVGPREAKRYLSTSLSAEVRERYRDDPLFLRVQSEVAKAVFDGFEYCGDEYPSEPKSAFYDYLYVKALSQPHNRSIAEELLRYRVFTDIEFTPKDSRGKPIRFNTQARSCAIYVSLASLGEIEKALSGIDRFITQVGYEREEAMEWG